MPGGPQNIRTQERARVEGTLYFRIAAARGTHPDGPLCGRVILSLDGAEAGDDLSWTLVV